MREVLRSNDAVLIGFAQSVLRHAGIASFVADQYMSVVEGSIGAFPRRLLVGDGGLGRGSRRARRGRPRADGSIEDGEAHALERRPAGAIRDRRRLPRRRAAHPAAEGRLSRRRRCRAAGGGGPGRGRAARSGCSTWGPVSASSAWPWRAALPMPRWCWWSATRGWPSLRAPTSSATASAGARARRRGRRGAPLEDRQPAACREAESFDHVLANPPFHTRRARHGRRRCDKGRRQCHGRATASSAGRASWRRWPGPAARPPSSTGPRRWPSPARRLRRPLRRAQRAAHPSARGTRRRSACSCTASRAAARRSSSCPSSSCMATTTAFARRSRRYCGKEPALEM